MNTVANSIIIAELDPLITLAYVQLLDRLLSMHDSVHISDTVIHLLQKDAHLDIHKKILEFIRLHLGAKLKIVDTRVSGSFDRMLELKVDPVQESIRRIIDEYEAPDCGKHAMLVSNHHKYLRPAEQCKHLITITIRDLINALEMQNILEDPDELYDL